MSKFFHWLPRILVILLVAFFLLMSLDIFAMGLSWQEVIVGLGMHNLPTLLLLVALVLAWKDPRMGGIVFILLAIAATFFFRTYLNVIVFLIVTGLPLLIGGLFFYEGSRTGEKKKS